MMAQAQAKRTRGEAGLSDGDAAVFAAPTASEEDVGGAEGMMEEEEEEGSGAGGDDAAEEEVLLPGADDPSYAEQYALWRERRFIDIWLQARTALRVPLTRSPRQRRDATLPQHATRRAALSRLAVLRHATPRSLVTPPALQAGQEDAPEGPRVPASRMLLASVSPYIRKLLLGTQQIPGLQGDTIHVGVPGGADALAQLVEARARAPRRAATHARPPRGPFWGRCAF
jgi:hypothetical protein